MSDSRKLAVAVIIALLVIATRSVSLTRNAFWLDEAYTAYAAERGLAFLWQVTPTYETHPPFYYSLVWAWSRMFGDSLLSLRLIAALASGATVFALWRFGRRLTRATGQKDWFHVLLAGMAACSAVLVWSAHQVRPYALLILVFTLAMGIMTRLASRWMDTRPTFGADCVLWVLLLAALAWLHNLGPLFAATLGLALVILTVRRDWMARDWAIVIGLHLAVVALWLPAAALLARQIGDWQASTWLIFDPTLLPRYLIELFSYADPMSGLLLLGLAINGLWALRAHPRWALSLVVLATLPVIATILLSLTVTPVFLPRVLMPCAVPALVLAAVGAANPPMANRLVWRAVVAIFLLLSLFAAISSAVVRRPQNWAPPTDWLAKQVRPGDEIWAYPNETALPLRRAMKDRGLNWAVHPIPGEVPAAKGSGTPMAGTSAAVAIPDAAMERRARIAASSLGRRTLWLVELNAGIYDPRDRFVTILGQLLACRERRNDDNIRIVSCVARHSTR